MNFETVISSIMGVAGTIVASFIWEKKIRDRVSVRRIKSSKDKDIHGLIEIYAELFPDDTVDYDAEEIRAFFDEEDEHDGSRHVKVDNILLAAKFKGAVVGFIFCHYYPERKKAIISYFGIDKNVLEARKFAAIVMLKHLERLLIRKYKECEYLFFDVARPEKQLSEAEFRERKARISLFMQSARSIGKKAYVFQFDYHSPKVSLSHESQERPLVLMFIPLKGSISMVISKAQVIAFLQFIFLDCYGDIYRIDDPKFKEYQQHLKENVREFEVLLPEEILLGCNYMPNNRMASDTAIQAAQHKP